MKAVLPILPSAAPSAAPEANPQHESPGDEETFASVLDRLILTGKLPVETGAATCAESEVTAPEASEVAPREEEVEPEPTALPHLPLTLVLPALPFHPIAEPRLEWNPIAGGAATRGTSDEHSAASADPGISTAEKPAQKAPVISAGQGQSLPIPNAMFPIPMAQLQVQLQALTEPAAKKPSAPAAPLNPHDAIPPAFVRVPAEERVVSEPSIARPVMDAEIAPMREHQPIIAEFTPAPHRAFDSAAPRSDTSVAAPPQARARPWLTPAAHREAPVPAPIRQHIPRPGHDSILPIEAVAESVEAVPPPAISAPAALETALVESAQQPAGTSAAKRGEVMQATAFPAPVKPRAAKSADALEAPLKSVDLQMPTPPGESALAFESLAVERVATTHAAIRKTPEHRLAKESRFDFQLGPPTGVQAVAQSQPEFSVRHFRELQPATAVEPTTRKESDHQPGSKPRMDVEASVPVPFQAARPQTDRVTTDPVKTEAPVDRAEFVQIVERTADAAVRMRAVGGERVEVAVQLDSGDRLTIQLHIANGEVTPHFRTSSEGLRTALEQNWAQFSDRANDRGVRLTPPVFDASQSSANMSDLSQQHHGRDSAYTEAQAGLFPHRPRRMRPPRLLAAAPLESSPAPAAGVRTYA